VATGKGEEIERGTGMKVVDLGTSIGQALHEFSRKGPKYFSDDSNFVRDVFSTGPELFSGCLGVDKFDKYRADLEGLGASFLVMDLSTEENVLELPEADYYIASKLLHHLGSEEAMERLVRHILCVSRRGVWLRLLSFEDDIESGEGALSKYDLRFGWSCKYTPCSVKTIVSYVDTEEWDLELFPARRLRHTNDFRVLPTTSDPDKEEYEEVMGHKPQHELVPAVVAEWDLFIGKKHED
jgi:hypothetical protein